MTEPKIYKAKLSDFKPDPRNANLHTQRGRGLVEKSQRTRGFARPGFSAQDGTMLGGNLSVIDVGAEVFGVDSEVLVIETDGHTPIIHKRTDLAPDSPEARLLAIEDNRTAELSLAWDIPTLEFDLSQGLDLDGLWQKFELNNLLSEKQVIDYEKEWGGMPEYRNDDLSAYRTIIVHFANQDHVDEFSELIEQKFTNKTRAIWYPKVVIMPMDEIYVNEQP